MTQTAPPLARLRPEQPAPEPQLILVTPGQLAIVRDYLATGDPYDQIAARLKCSRVYVNTSLLRVARAGGWETPSQLMSAVLNRRARLVRDRPHSPIWGAASHTPSS